MKRIPHRDTVSWISEAPNIEWPGLRFRPIVWLFPIQNRSEACEADAFMICLVLSYVAREIESSSFESFACRWFRAHCLVQKYHPWYVFFFFTYSFSDSFFSMLNPPSTYNGDVMMSFHSEGISIGKKNGPMAQGLEAEVVTCNSVPRWSTWDMPRDRPRSPQVSPGLS